MHGIEFRHLRYFVAVHDCRSFTRAANALCVTQSTISKGMRELEDRLGAPLFFRHSNQVSLTAGGKQFLEYAQPLLELHHESVQQFRHTHSRSPDTLRIGTCFSDEDRIISAGISLYQQLFSASTLELSFGSTDEIFVSLRDGRIDAAFAPQPFIVPATRTVPLTSERILVCMRKDDELAAHRFVDASQINKRVNIFQNPSVHFAEHLTFMELLKESDIEPRALLFATSTEKQLESVQAGMGYTLVREHQDLPKDLVARPFASDHWKVDYALLYRPALRNRAVVLWSRLLARRLESKLLHVRN